jgi:ribonuclease Z
MMTFTVTILGSNSAAPATSRYPSSQVINVQDELFLVDCGEGTQMQIRKYKIKFQKINHIFISHLHGDHYLGLMGLIFTYHLLNRENPLHIYANKELEKLITLQLKVSNCRLVYPLVFHKLNEKSSELLYEDEKLTVESIPLKHSIPTSGFLFREKERLRNIKIEALKGENVDYHEFEKIKRGADYINPQGKLYKNEEITFPPPPARAYAYCSDTEYDESIIRYIKGADLLYFEATFKQDKAEVAMEKQHSTTHDAGNIALKAEVKKLLTGHFSARYEDEELGSLLEETRSIFANTELAIEGLTFDV